MYFLLGSPRATSYYLILVVTFSLTIGASSEESDDEFCTELTSLHYSASDYSNIDAGRAPTCFNFQNYISSEQLLTLTKVIHPPVVCWVDPIISWYINCTKHSEPHTLNRSKTKMKKGCIQHHNNTAPSFVDILFMVERSERMPVNEAKRGYFKRAVETLADAMNNEKNYISSRFGLIVYNLDGPDVLTVQDFEPLYSPLDIDAFVLKSAFENSTIQDPIDVTMLQHFSIEQTLKVIDKVLGNLENYSQSDELFQLHPRTISDLHIISLLDLYHPSTAQRSSTPKKLVGNSVGKSQAQIERLISAVITKASNLHSNPLSVHFVFDRYNKPAVGYLGDPSYSSHYNDCSHFNKASTLKTLLKSGTTQSSTLQAHLLSKGILIKTLTWNDFKHQDCVFGISPMLSTPFGVYPTFTNSCKTDNSDLKQDTSEHYYCSSTHGWIRRGIETQGEQNASDLFEGRTPISTEFSASHADLVAPKSNNKENDSVQAWLPLERLTIYERRKVKCHSPRIAGEPSILEWSPTRPIVQQIIGRKEPLVLRNTTVQSWPAMQKWNISYLAENIGLDIFQSVKCTNTFLTFDPDRRTPLKLNISIPFVERNMTRDSFFNCVEGSLDSETFPCSDDFMGHYYFGPVPAALKQDLIPDRFLYHTDKDYKSNRQYVWISSSGMITHTHFDQDYNFFVQLIGKKRFTLWSPFQHELMYMYPRVHPMWHKSQVNFRDVDMERFPAFSRARAVQIELGPGDILYVPPYTWHYVETLSPSVSLSTWSNDYNVYNHMNSIYRHDHKFDLIEDPRGKLNINLCRHAI